MGGQLTRSLIYALGGGRGHATRAGRLARELTLSGDDVRVLVPEGKKAFVPPDVDVREIEKASDAAVLRGRVESELDEFSADHLIVDALPLGVLGELRGLGRRSHQTLLLRLLRDLPPLGFYDTAIDLEPQLGWFRGGIGCGPVAPDSPTLTEEIDVLLVPTDPVLLRFFEKLGRRLRAKGLSVADRGESLAEVRPAVVVGAAGYNLTYEALAAGVPHLALPRPRRFDDQARRAREVAETCTDPDSLEARILDIVARREARAAVGCHSYAELAALCQSSTNAFKRSSASSH